MLELFDPPVIAIQHAAIPGMAGQGAQFPDYFGLRNYLNPLSLGLRVIRQAQEERYRETLRSW